MDEFQKTYQKRIAKMIEDGYRKAELKKRGGNMHCPNCQSGAIATGTPNSCYGCGWMWTDFGQMPSAGQVSSQNGGASQNGCLPVPPTPPTPPPPVVSPGFHVTIKDMQELCGNATDEVRQELYVWLNRAYKCRM